MTPFIVTATLATGRVVLPDPWSGCLDGILAAAVLQNRLGERYGYSNDPDVFVELGRDDLPLATREHDGMWWFEASAPLYAPGEQAGRNPVTENIVGRQDPYTARLWCDKLPKTIQTQGGRYRNILHPVAVQIADSVSWAGNGDVAAVRELLDTITYVGGRRRNGNGKVASWAVEAVDRDDPEWLYRDALPGPTRPVPVGWASTRFDDVFPVPLPIRPPYHHTHVPRHVEVAARW